MDLEISRARFNKQRDPNRVISTNGPRGEWPHDTTLPQSPYPSITLTSHMRQWSATALKRGMLRERESKSGAE
jgi:hypothetical protein